ncbi:MAG: type II/IV secretion system protein [Candidatus Gracilibacteria bacterium]|nr:type II/IV secretion system protein [Candidatus Gracilibacteria bacterium]
MELQGILKKSPDKNETPQVNKKNVKVEDLFSMSSGTSGSKKNHMDSDMNVISVGGKNDNNGTITLVNDIFLEAMKLGASDIHIEPRDKQMLVRYRVDGNFINKKQFPLNLRDSIIARIKILAYLRIDEHRLPQDGKINFKLFGGKTVDMRVSVIPNIYGEKCVIRILKKDSSPPELKALGIMPYNMVKIKKHLNDSYGMILAVGPTGSGKSTTLFSLLSQFDAEEKNISTLEDPVEYRIPGVNHTQINPNIKFTFASGLRSLLRQDPDIIMVGEVRDEETAKLAVEASITGHIVFSTLHTNSASHTIQRLVNLGVDPLLISSSLRVIISQRLARKLCTHCKEDYIPSEKIKSYIIGKVGKYMKDKESVTLYSAKDGGCPQCNNTGYKGRIGLYEVLEMTDKIEELLLKNASRLQLEVQAVGDGMVPIKEDALIKVVLGDTSIEEILSVLGT